MFIGCRDCVFDFFWRQQQKKKEKNERKWQRIKLQRRALFYLFSDVILSPLMWWMNVSGLRECIRKSDSCPASSCGKKRRSSSQVANTQMHSRAKKKKKREAFYKHVSSFHLRQARELRCNNFALSRLRLLLPTAPLRHPCLSTQEKKQKGG